MRGLILASTRAVGFKEGTKESVVPCRPLPRDRVSPPGPEPSPGSGFRFTRVSCVVSICLRDLTYVPGFAFGSEQDWSGEWINFLCLSEYLSM